MRSRAWCLAAIAACCLTELVAPPARAGWAADMGRMVVNSLVRQAVNRMVQRQSYQQQHYYSPPGGVEPPADTSHYSYTPPPNHSATVHHSHGTSQTQHSTTAHNANLHYPTDNKFIPPPPPYPVVYPGGSDTAISTAGSGKHGMDLVPPPPPSPSVWDDVTPASAVTARALPSTSPLSEPKRTQPAPIKQADSKQSGANKPDKVGGYTRHASNGSIIGKADTKNTGSNSNHEEEPVSAGEEVETMPKPAPDLHQRKVAAHRMGHSGT